MSTSLLFAIWDHNFCVSFQWQEWGHAGPESPERQAGAWRQSPRGPHEHWRRSHPRHQEVATRFRDGRIFLNRHFLNRHFLNLHFHNLKQGIFHNRHFHNLKQGKFLNLHFHYPTFFITYIFITSIFITIKNNVKKTHIFINFWFWIHT